MKFFVVVSSDSAIGAAYQQNQIPVAVGQETHVAFDCEELDTSNHRFAFIKTMPNEFGGVRQQLQLPYEAILFIVQYDANGKRPAGFGA